MTHGSIPSVAVFDVYDTLLHWRHTVEEMATEVGQTVATILTSSGDLALATDIGEITYLEYGVHMAERWGMPDYAERVIAGLAPIQAVHDLAVDFHEAGSRLVLASNVGQGALRMSFERGVLPPLERFARIFQSCKLGIAKPDLAFFEHIIEQTGVPAVEHIFHDDNESNVAAAQETGMQGAHINPDDIEGSVARIREHYLPHTLAA